LTPATSAPAARILFADDHPIFCAGLRRLIEVEAGLEVVGEARNGADAVDLIDALRPDLVLIDLNMPRMSGVEVLAELTRRAVAPHPIVLTAEISRRDIVEVLRLGARGVVLKEAASELLFAAIRTVLSGQCWVGRESVGDLLQYLRAQSAALDRPKFRLTPRERQVVAAVTDGLTNKEIARRFMLSEDTIKHHLSSIFDKIGVSNRLELALAAIEHDLLDPHGRSRN
jgi:two-component system nitrate/nitrite response regulator NarL